MIKRKQQPTKMRILCFHYTTNFNYDKTPSSPARWNKTMFFRNARDAIEQCIVDFLGNESEKKIYIL